MKKVSIILPVPKEYKKLKVAAYCRVSTSRPEQLRSLEIQIKTYTKLIKDEPNWIVDGTVSTKTDREHPASPFERYADDAIIHCRTEEEAESILKDLEGLGECKLKLNPQKTKIVYCKDKDRTKEYENTQFDFLGYTFRPTFIKDKTGRLQWNFLPSVSKKSAKAFRMKIRQMKVHSWTGSKVYNGLPEQKAGEMGSVQIQTIPRTLKTCTGLAE